MLSIIKNDWNRLKEEKLYIGIAIGLTICAVIIAIVITTQVQSKINLAVVGKLSGFTGTNEINITYLDEEPKQSELVKNRYDAVLTIEKDGSYQIRTIKSDELKQQLETALQDYFAGNKQEMEVTTDARKIGTNIIGFMLLFILVQGIMYARLFAEEKEKHLIERIAISPIGFYHYLIGHTAFCWILIAVPSFLVVMIADLLGVQIGFNILQYAIFIGLLSFLSTAFAICINSFFDVADSANMIGTTIVLLTTILSGSFCDMEVGQSFLNKLLYVFPQKGFMQFLEQFENHNLSFHGMIGLIYVIICAVVLVMIGVIRTKKNYIFRS